MRFCNESANIGTFWELATKGFKNIRNTFSILGIGAVFASISTAIAPFKVIFGSEDHEPLLIDIIVSGFQSR